VLGVGFAAFRDVESFFRYEAADADGQANLSFAKTRSCRERAIQR